MLSLWLVPAFVGDAVVGTSEFEGACDGIKVAFPLKIDEGAAEEPEILGIKVLFDFVPFTLILGAEL